MTAKPKPKTLPCGRPLPAKKETTEDAAALLEKFGEQLNLYCGQKKLNRSEAREKILETIVSEARHFTAIELLAKLQKKFPEIGKATMYRNLPVLVESEVLREGPRDPEGQVLYELASEHHHDHIVCLDCRHIFEFHDKGIEKKQEQITAGLKFTAKDHSHVIFAACDFFHQK